MANGQLIQLFLADPPLRNEAIHQGDEAGVVSRFQHVNHLVDDDVFEAFAWFLREIGVQSDARARQGWYGFDGYTPPLRSGRGTFGLTSGKTRLLEQTLAVLNRNDGHPWSPRRPHIDHLRPAVPAIVLWVLVADTPFVQE